MKKITYEIAKAIQDINGDPGLTAEDKIKKIEALDGASFEMCLNFLEKNFSTGPKLSEYIRKLISKNRPTRKTKAKPKKTTRAKK
jgi:hypothetical protein